MTVCLDLWVRPEKLSSIGAKINVFSPQAWDSRVTHESWQVYNGIQCISKVKEPCSSSVTSANAMPTSVKNFQVFLTLRLLCHAERVYEEIILCKTSLSIKTNCFFLRKITALATYLKKQSPFYQEKIEPMGFFPSFSFQFHSSYVNKTNWRKCFQNYSSQNAAIQENLETNEVCKG